MLEGGSIRRPRSGKVEGSDREEKKGGNEEGRSR